MRTLNVPQGEGDLLRVGHSVVADEDRQMVGGRVAQGIVAPVRRAFHELRELDLIFVAVFGAAVALEARRTVARRFVCDKGIVVVTL